MTFVDAHTAISGWRRVYGPAECENCGAWSSARTIYAAPLNRHDPDEGDQHICFLCLCFSAAYAGVIHERR